MRTALALVGVLALSGGAALAQRAATAPTAETLYTEGQAAYDKGDFATAVTRWQASYKASDEPALLFNIAQALRRNGQCKEALFTYQRFLALDPTAKQQLPEDFKIAEDFIRDPGSQCSTATPLPAAPPPARDESPTDVRRAERVAGIATGGAGAALFITGLLVGSHASSLSSQVSKACTPAAPCDWATYGPIDASGRHDATVGRVLDVFGVVALAGGATLYYLGSRAPEAMVTPVVAPHDAGAVLTWRHAW